MKIGILTHYDVNNMGAQLQLWAMYRHLESLGHEPVVLTYKKSYDFVPELERRNQITLASVPYILKNYLFAKGLGSRGTTCVNTEHSRASALTSYATHLTTLHLLMQP